VCRTYGAGVIYAAPTALVSFGGTGFSLSAYVEARGNGLEVQVVFHIGTCTFALAVENLGCMELETQGLQGTVETSTPD
jgi:hypothetical protein